jgi:seryl-tRNA synthetase
MLDLKYVLANVDAVKQNCINRNAPQSVVDSLENISNVYASYSNTLTNLEHHRRKQNEIAKETGKERDPARRADLIEHGRQNKESIQHLEDQLRQYDGELKTILSPIPNLTHPDAPVGRTEDQSREVRRVGTPRTFDFTPRDHVEIGKALGLIDFEAGGKVAGHGFYYLKGDAVLLDLALQQFAVSTLVRHGFTPVVTPDLARSPILEGIGFNPRGAETQVYSVENSDLCLIGTAEITLGGLHADEVLSEADLPLKYGGLSHCFRTEAGAAGRASKGLYRVHQFTKVEMFAFTTPETSGAVLEQILAIEEEIFTALGVPYRVLDICSGDLGGPAYRKFDLEAWMPGRGDGGEYGEVTSASDCTDYQSRRLNTRYKPAVGKGTRFVHTLNGTAVALSRALIVILENYQRADGRVDVPEVLRPYLGKIVIGG